MIFNIDEKLKHLDTESINNLMKLYYDNKKSASELIKLYNINISPSRLYKLFPPEKVNAKYCPYCGSEFYINRPSKTSYPQNNNVAFCSNCTHKDSLKCNCDNCVSERKREIKNLEEKKKIEELEKRNLIDKLYGKAIINPLDISELDFKDRVYLGTLLRYALSEDMSNIIPLENLDGVLAPACLEYELLKHLYQKNIIRVHPMSKISAFENDEDFPSTFYMNLVNYHLNIKYENDKSETIREIINPRIDIDEQQAYFIWNDIAMNECLEYLNYQMDKVGFNFNPGEKTILVMSELLDNFSVSQIYSIIYRSITNATRYYQEGNVSKKQAANSVITKCQSYGEVALSNQWEIKGYSRIKDLPQSSLSEFLFNRVLKIGDNGFNAVPSIDFLVE
ncbi:zinc ribbon domain-containing protein [Clostridioides sp. ZZV15-6383]|uniref:zinc ribbon domain-containing protein n=1 Tax=unclassified Clostridioides TaxID=2635829 RepID=UPI001D0FC87D|nr:zinc ribbon domain-containing protein [Clostridioides sp. ZZV15-6597]MCC0698465.1 zinc ribbon domain-containing protein [Clostridioides sp. ZZV15-6383]